jgi:hypothetical protein
MSAPLSVSSILSVGGRLVFSPVDGTEEVCGDWALGG